MDSRSTSLATLAIFSCGSLRSIALSGNLVRHVVHQASSGPIMCDFMPKGCNFDFISHLGTMKLDKQSHAMTIRDIGIT